MKATIAVLAGLAVSATAAVAAALMGLPGGSIHETAAARLDASLPTLNVAASPSAPASASLSHFAASKAGKAQAPRYAKAKVKPDRSKPSAKANGGKPAKKASKALIKRAKPVPKKRPATSTANS
jgi:hypothetical protein